MKKDRALFIYGFDIDNNNKYINFKTSSMGAQLTGTMTVGNYTCTEFLAEIKRVMELADGVNKYTIAIDRSINSGTSNTVAITTNGSYLTLLFGTGSNSANSPRLILGFDQADYIGGLSYAGTINAGTILYPDFPTYDYLGPDDYITNDGTKNVSASGIKETLVFAQMQFLQGSWKYITDFNSNTQLTQWRKFLKYGSRQLKFEFTPSTAEDSSLFYQVTIETTASDGNGMGYKLNQMLGQNLYRFYDTGLIKMRKIPS